MSCIKWLIRPVFIIILIVEAECKLYPPERSYLRYIPQLIAGRWKLKCNTAGMFHTEAGTNRSAEKPFRPPSAVFLCHPAEST
jgi:hypothetical protein